MDRFQFLATACILLLKEDKIFLIRRKDTGYFDGSYECPAGHLDGNETVRMAAAREALEEVGIVIRPEDLQVVHVMHRYGEKHERIEFFLVATSWGGEPSNQEPEHCDDAAWFPLDALPENLVPKFRFALEQYQSRNVFSEYDWKS